MGPRQGEWERLLQGPAALVQQQGQRERAQVQRGLRREQLLLEAVEAQLVPGLAAESQVQLAPQQPGPVVPVEMWQQLEAGLLPELAVQQVVAADEAVAVASAAAR